MSQIKTAIAVNQSLRSKWCQTQELMKKFHSNGTLWTSIEHIIETPFFVNSELTSLVQIADLCSFTLRRYFENNETELFDRIKPRFDRKNSKIVGFRHFTESSRSCEICS